MREMKKFFATNLPCSQLHSANKNEKFSLQQRDPDSDDEEWGSNGIMIKTKSIRGWPLFNRKKRMQAGRHMGVCKFDVFAF